MQRTAGKTHLQQRPSVGKDERAHRDSPLNIWMGSLLWQENLSHPMEALGAIAVLRRIAPKGKS
jgi:hypothetical protein